MEDVLAVYTLPYDPRFPQVCIDETTKQMVGEIRTPLPPDAGQPTRYDSEYVRNGVSHLFMVCEPLRGWRHVVVAEQHTGKEWAQCLKELVDVHYPQAECIRLVCDNLSTHTPAALYATFPPEEAARIAAKIAWHYTPKHGSWLDMAEIELSALSRQCLDQRLPDKAAVERVIAAWEAERNTRRVTITWRFTTPDARIKLRHLYPVLTPI